MADVQRVLNNLRDQYPADFAVLDEHLRGISDRLIDLTAELEAVRRDAERWRYVNANAEWHRVKRDDYYGEPYAALVVRLPYGTDLSSKGTRADAIDKALSQTVALVPVSVKEGKET